MDKNEVLKYVEYVNHNCESQYRREDKCEDLNKKSDEVIGKIKSFNKEEKENVIGLLYNALENVNDEAYIYIMSVIEEAKSNEENIIKILERVLYSTNLNMYNKKFVLLQMVEIVKNKYSDSKKIIELEKKINDEIINHMKKEINKYKYISKKERNKEFIMVFAPQVLDIAQIGTRISLDVAKVLSEKFNKKVILINTKERLNNNGYVNLKDINLAAQQIDESIVFVYDNCKIPIYHPSNHEKNMEEYFDILDMVEKYRPYAIFTIGNLSFIGELCKSITDVANIHFDDEELISNYENKLEIDKFLYKNEESMSLGYFEEECENFIKKLLN